jgi:hypothetical protein
MFLHDMGQAQTKGGAQGMKIQAIICKALDEGRLAYKNMTHHGQSCNGGKLDNRPYYPKGNNPGKWLPEIKDISECETGYHVTLEPIKWAGNQVALIETRLPVTKLNKQVFSSYRILKILTPEDCISISLWSRINYPYLSGAYLSGAYLSGANLCGAYLSGADLRGANLCGANLCDAYLSGAYLSGAYLSGADLRGAYLRGAYLRGANLCGADLRGADLRGANLCGANLCDAYLSGAYLSGAYSNIEYDGYKLQNGILVKE